MASTLGCGDTVKPPEEEPRPEGWIARHLEGISVERVILTEDWLYACANNNGLFRISPTAKAGADWISLGLNDFDVPDASFGVMDIVAEGERLIVGVSSGRLSPDIPGILLSVDDGQTWQASDSGFVIDDTYTGTGVVIRLKQSPHDPSFLLAGCSGQNVLYRSLDSGNSWELIHQKPGLQLFYTLGFHPINEQEVWAGGMIDNSGVPVLEKTIDGGKTWQDVLNRPVNHLNLDSVNDITFDMEASETVYVALDQIIIKSQDSGETWSTVFDTLDVAVLSLPV